MKSPQYTYSQLSSDSVGDLVTLHYDFPSIIFCRFYVLGLHDNYLIESKNEQFIFRIYRNDWRSEQKIEFELELLDFIGAVDEFVSALISTNSSELSFFIDSPEGKSSAALFHYADGFSPGK